MANYEPNPATRPSLLLRIRNSSDTTAWDDFVSVYAPVIVSYAKRRGLSSEQSADVTQEVLFKVANQAKNFDYDANKGSFRGWLKTICRNQAVDYLRRESRHPTAKGDTECVELLQSLPDDRLDDVGAWESDYRRYLLDWAMEKVRPAVTKQTWAAFTMAAIDGLSTKDIAARLKISDGAVYTARSRVQARIRAVIDEFDET